MKQPTDLAGINKARQDKIISFLTTHPLIKVAGIVNATGINMLKQVMSGAKYSKLQPAQMDKIEEVLKEYGFKP